MCKSKTVEYYDFAAFGCLFLSGMLALAYEVCWIRKSSLVFGATSLAVATTLAIFFGGMALGNYVFGLRAERLTRPLRIYAIVEFGIGFLALLSPLAFSAVDAIYVEIYPRVHSHFALLSLSRFILLCIIFLPPAFLVGGTLPLLCRQFVQSKGRISRGVGFLYGINTMGAAVGCAVTGLFMIRYVGVDRTIIIAGILNLILGVFAWKLPQTAPGQHSFALPALRNKVTADENTRPLANFIMPMLFFVSGFVALGNEVLWVRYLSLLIHNTIYIYTLTLTLVLSGIVLGSMLTARYFDHLRRRALVFGLLQVAIGLSVLTVLLLPADWWHSWHREYDTQMEFWLLVLILLPPAILSGVSFPLAVRMVVTQPIRAGWGVGTMAALNTAGGVVGSLVVGFVALPRLGLHGSLMTTTALSVLCGVVAWTLLEKQTSKWLRSVLIVMSGALWLMIPKMSATSLPQDFLAGEAKLIDYREGLNSFMAVVLKHGKVQLEIDRLWQGEDGRNHQSMAAHIPMLHHKRPEEILVIGIGTGQTARRFLMYPTLKRLDCVDLERELVDLVRPYFESQWMDDPRVQIITEDGRNYLTYTPNKYDVISIEAGQTFRPGVAPLYSLDFYKNARRRLKPGGILAQFVPISLLNPEQFLTVVKTFLEAFPQSALWYNSSELLLIGTVADQLSLPNDYLARLTQSSTLQKDMEFSYWGGPKFWVSHPQVFAGGFLCGPDGLQRLTKDASIYRDEIPSLEYMIPAESMGHERAIVDLIEEVLEPPIALLSKSTAVQNFALAEETQRWNLGDLRGMASSDAAKKHLNLRQLSAAIKFFRQAAESNPKSVEFLNNLGMALRASGDFRRAENQFRAVLAEDPRSALALNNLGITLLEQRRTREAIPYLERAVTIKPDYEDAYYNLGNALLSARRLQEAVSNYKTAIALDPEDVVNYVALIQALIILEELQQAQTYYLEAKKIAPNLSPPPGFDAWAN